MSEIKQILQQKKQYTVNSSITTDVNNSKQYTVLETRGFVESLDARVYCNSQFLPFYCKAARMLGFPRMLELQKMVISDPRINQPDKFCAERVFWCLLKDDMQRRRCSIMSAAK